MEVRVLPVAERVEQDLNAVDFTGFTSMASNTWQNLFPMHTGYNEMVRCARAFANVFSLRPIYASTTTSSGPGRLSKGTAT